MTIPGIGRRIAEVIVAETGGDMARFASSSRLAAWAGLAPGDNESAGKRKKAAARKGNRHLRSAMVEAAWAVSRTASRPGARFRRLAYRFGRPNVKKAAVAVAHTLLCVAWAIMKRDQDYAKAGADYYQQRDQRNHEHLAGTIKPKLLDLDYANMGHDLPKRCPEQDSVLATGPRPERPGTRPRRSSVLKWLPRRSCLRILLATFLVCSVESPQVIAPFQPTRRRNLGLRSADPARLPGHLDPPR